MPILSLITRGRRPSPHPCQAGGVLLGETASGLWTPEGLALFHWMKLWMWALVSEWKSNLCGFQVCGLVWEAVWGGGKNEGLCSQTPCPSLAV